MSPHSIAHLPRRLLNAVAGAGPWRVRPFATELARRTSPHRLGVHRPEYFDGIVAEAKGGTASYVEGRPLLGQKPEWEHIGGRPRYLSSGLAPADSTRLYLMTDVGVAGADGVVYCPESRTAVAESVRRWVRPDDTHPLLGAARYPGAVPLPGLSLSIAALDTQGFYHFLHEALPRLWLARPHLKDVRCILVTGPEDAQRSAWLAEAGIPPESVIWLHGLAHYRCEQLLFADLPMRDYQPSPWNRNALRDLFNAHPATEAREKIWISRSDARTRHLRWEDTLLEALPGFRKVVLSNLSPRRQIEEFSSAHIVAGPHGAGMAGLVFSPPGGRFIEIFPPGRLQPIYGRLAQVCGLESAWAAVDFEHDDARAALAAAINEWIAADAPSR